MLKFSRFTKNNCQIALWVPRRPLNNLKQYVEKKYEGKVNVLKRGMLQKITSAIVILEIYLTIVLIADARSTY